MSNEKHQFGHRSEKGTYIDTKFSENAEIYGSPVLQGCNIQGGRVFGQSSLYLSNMTGSPMVTDQAQVINSHLYGRAIVADQSRVISSVIADDSKVLDHARVDFAVMFDHSIVCGTGIVMGSPFSVVSLNGYAYVSEGVWTRPPITYITKAGWIINESIGDRVTVSCTTNSVHKWLSGAGRRYGKLIGMQPEDIDEVEHWVQEIARFKGVKI